MNKVRILFHKERMSLWLILCTIIAAALPAQSFAADENIAGIWQGTLKVQTIELRIVFHVAADSSGAFKTTMDSPDQGAKGIVVNSTSVSSDSVVFAIYMINGTYEGIRQQGDSLIIGTWKQGSASFPLDLRRVKEIQEARRPQEPKPPFPYDAEDVSFENKNAGITLAGTFTKPKTGAPFTTVLLITGSGPQNRDEELLGHKPFLVLADYLTRRGIAVLRVDDRGVGKSTGVFGTATTVDFAGDVRAGIDYLKTRNDVDAKKIGLIGHSEGGIIAPMVSADSKDVAFIVLMAGTSLTGEKILYMQDSLISLAMGQPPKEVEKDLSEKRAMYSLLKEEHDTTKLQQDLHSIVDKSLAEDSSLTDKTKEIVIAATMKQLLSPWFRFFLTYDPMPALEKVTCPILALNGSKDMQVPAQANLEGMERAFKTSGSTRATTKLLPGLNHLFQKADTGSPMEYAKIEETMDPEALKTIGDWIEEVTK